MEETARPAVAADGPTITALAEQAIGELAVLRGGDVWRRQAARQAPVSESIASAIDDDRQHVVAGCIDDVIVGYSVARLELLPDGTTLAVLDDLYTDPGARAVGVGEAMMDEVVRWSTERGAFGIDSIALPGDRHTKNFFESFGLVARAIVVHKSLE